MDDKKLKRLGAELQKARAKQAEWAAKVRDLERRYREAENTYIHEMVHAAHLSPEELAVIIGRARAGAFDRSGEASREREMEEEVIIDE